MSDDYYHLNLDNDSNQYHFLNRDVSGTLGALTEIIVAQPMVPGHVFAHGWLLSMSPSICVHCFLTYVLAND